MTLNFLVDVNLPKHFNFFNKPNFHHVVEINRFMSDNEIWNHALQNNFIILTKDSDFYFRALISTTKPKIVYFQLGNQTLKELYQYFEKHWQEITDNLNSHSFIVALPSSIIIVL